MNLNYQENKVLGPQTSRLVLSLYERQRPIFRLQEAQEILGGDYNSAQQRVFDLVERGIATRLKPGLFQLVPFELGFEREYLGNPYVVARELARARRATLSAPSAYHLSHGSAFELHQMTTQPQLVVYTTVAHLVRPRSVLGTEFRFVRCKSADLFGIEEMWIDKNEKIQVSDLERTILDGLKQPDYCGGMVEVAKGLWIKREALDLQKLVGYALKLNIGSVIRRLGFLIELYSFPAAAEIERLRGQLTATYHRFDPGLVAEGKFISRWKLQLNISEAELLSAVRT